MKKIIFLFMAAHLLLSCERNDMFDISKTGYTKLKITPGDTVLYLSWDAINSAVSYEVWYNSLNDPLTAIQSNGDILVTSETITVLTNYSLYYVWLKVKYDDGGTSKIITSGTGTPMPIPNPPNISPNPNVTVISLNWTPIPGADSYQVWYGTTPVQGAAIQVGGDITGSGYSILGLTSGTTYYIWMTSKNAAGTSVFSSMATVTTL